MVKKKKKEEKEAWSHWMFVGVIIFLLFFLLNDFIVIRFLSIFGMGMCFTRFYDYRRLSKGEKIYT